MKNNYFKIFKLLIHIILFFRLAVLLFYDKYCFVKQNQLQHKTLTVRFENKYLSKDVENLRIKL